MKFNFLFYLIKIIILSIRVRIKKNEKKKHFQWYVNSENS